jgi:hypothetical protein
MAIVANVNHHTYGEINMIKSIIAGIVVAVAIAIPTITNAANTPTVTSVVTGERAGMDVFVVTLSNGVSANVDMTAAVSSDNPTTGNITSYRFDNGWFSDGIAVTQPGVSWYGEVR